MIKKEEKLVITRALAIAAIVALGFSFKSLKPQHQPAVQAARKPNIIFILSDDLSMNDLPAYGGTQARTPNLDKLASQGVCIENMFNMVPVCSPTRQSILTGLGPVRSGAYPNHTMIYDGIKTLPVYMHDLGYNAAIIGKRHYAPAAAYPFDFLGGRDNDNGKGKDVDLSKAEAYVKQSGDKPFFLMFASNQSHEPYTRGDQKAYDPDKIKLHANMVDTRLTRLQMTKYYAEVTYLDSLVGVCMDIVERSGQKDNTVIVYASEQGNAFPFSKWTLYDQGLRSALIVRWPGVVKPGTRNPAMLNYSDLLPTFIDIAGGDSKKINTGSKDANGNMGFDGISFKDVLTHGVTHKRDYVFAEETTRGIIKGSDAYAIRSARNSKFLYIHNLNYQNKFENVVTHSPLYKEWLATDPKRAAFYQVRPEEELYDVVKDPFNLHNIVADAKYAAQKALLKQKLAEFMKQQNDKGVETEKEAFDRQPKNEPNN